MPSSHFPYTVLILLLTSAFLARCQEFIQETFCWNQDFRLDCTWNSVLAFHEAYFTNDGAQVNRSTCADIRDGREPCIEDIRTSINKRCSGMSHCHYNFTVDHPERECRCKGVIVLRYSCIPGATVSRPYSKAEQNDLRGALSSASTRRGRGNPTRLESTAITVVTDGWSR
ncbi:hypothetical protein TNIN_86061 [Trichonephila inaurata madagascariensis]|uniref:Uncharacterized protein n=1 Tax=Trichonephila inaurata madagascariensis TaxID=2747483 RepID=A0A8X6XC98_9ARAC|nr:hypothetical protein TNIN_86061 [Trichonephila inaurata madagascariensis]